jgi:hypothetical protein
MEGREEVAEEAEVVCSARMVVLWAMHALRGIRTRNRLQNHRTTY